VRCARNDFRIIRAGFNKRTKQHFLKQIDVKLAAIADHRVGRPALLTRTIANAATAILIIMAMTIGLIRPRMVFERVLPAPA
jgi:hypothetical protein